MGLVYANAEVRLISDSNYASHFIFSTLYYGRLYKLKGSGAAEVCCCALQYAMYTIMNRRQTAQAGSSETPQGTNTNEAAAVKQEGKKKTVLTVI